jgi:hypothetical protein
VGAAVVDGFRDLGAVWVPAFSASYGWADGWIVGLSFHGLGPAATLNGAAGTASVEEQLATVDLVKTWWPRWAVVPLLCAGAGVQHVHAHGSASAPYRGVIADDWSLFTSAGAGAAVRLYGGLSLVLDARAAAAWPPTAVRIGGATAGLVGAPSLLASARVLGVFP